MKKLSEISHGWLVFWLFVCAALILVAAVVSEIKNPLVFHNPAIYAIIAILVIVFIIVNHRLQEIEMKKKREEERTQGIIAKEVERTEFMPPDEKFGRLHNLNGQLGGEE
jgi:hypothetical protein